MIWKNDGPAVSIVDSRCEEEVSATAEMNTEFPLGSRQTNIAGHRDGLLDGASLALTPAVQVVKIGAE